MTSPEPIEQSPDIPVAGVPVDPDQARLSARVEGLVGHLARDDDTVVQVAAKMLFEGVVGDSGLSISKRTVYDAFFEHPLVERRGGGMCWIYPTPEAKEAFYAPEIVVLAGPELSDVLSYFYTAHQGGRVKDHPRNGRGRHWRDPRRRE